MLVQLVILVVFFLLGVIGFLKFIFDKYLSSALKRMQELQARTLEKEVALNKELERAIQYRQSEIAKGKEEADKLKAQAREEVAKIKEQLLAQAKQAAEAALEEAKQEAGRLKEQLYQEAHSRAVHMATEAIKGIFSEKSKQTLGRDLVDELIADLRKVDKNKLKSEAKEAQVTSAYPLIDNQKNMLKEELTGLVGHEIQLEEKLDSSLISGLTINLGGTVLDGSLSSKMRKIISYLQEKK